MTTIPYAPRLTLVYCPDCGWNLKGTARWLRSRNLRYFAASLLLIPLAVPVFAYFHRLDPILGYVLDLFFIFLLFVPALIRARRNQTAAFRLDRLAPRQPLRPETDWRPEPELAAAPPRPVHGSGDLGPLVGLMAAIRLLAGMVMAALLFSLPPIAGFVAGGGKGGTLQFVALLVLVATLPPFLGLLTFLGVFTRRQRMIVSNGTPIRGEVSRQETVMRRLRTADHWTLATRLRYTFEDREGRSYAGTGREVGRAIAEGDALTVLILPDDPASHLAYQGALYRAGEPPAG
jgi:hypothetical protein